MLKVFRQVAGLPAPGEDMGGWYTSRFQPRDAIPWLHRRTQLSANIVSGLARAYARDRIEADARKVHRLVKGYAETLDPKASSSGLPSARLHLRQDCRCGLIDAHEFARDPMALDVTEKLDARRLRLPAGESAVARREARAAAQGHVLHLGRVYTLPENFPGVPAQRRDVLPRTGEAVPGR